MSPLARAFVEAAPERMVWGSDWPHPSAKQKPDDTLLFDLLEEWVPDEAIRRRILVDNPEVLYGFPKSARTIQGVSQQPCAELILKCLESEGVEYMYGVPAKGAPT